MRDGSARARREANIRAPVHHRCRCHGRPRGENGRSQQTPPRGATMPAASRVIVAIAFALLVPARSLAAARAHRADQPREGRPEDQQRHAIGATQRRWRRSWSGPGVTISNAKFTGRAGGGRDVRRRRRRASAWTPASCCRPGRPSTSAVRTRATAGATSTARRATRVSTRWSTPEVTYDAAILEFDVTPAANTIAIRFVFASEEYPEFVGSSYNDVHRDLRERRQLRELQRPPGQRQLDQRRRQRQPLHRQRHRHAQHRDGRADGSARLRRVGDARMRRIT